jgi:alpha-beta hydrolase superfamily lysophospholipase
LTTIALIHSPLLGPFTWSLVADALRQPGWAVVMPDLHGDGLDGERPYHQQHAQNATKAFYDLPAEEPVVLVAHSGAGPLLPAIGQQLPQPIAAYLFVDAGIPHAGLSRLDLLAAELPEAVPHLHKLLTSGQRWPHWTNEDLAGLIPDASRRQKLLAELTPQPLAFFVEPIPVFPGWPDAPCAYLQLSASYDYSAAEARQRGWPVVRLEVGHFYMVVNETAVADHILALLAQLGLVTHK